MKTQKASSYLAGFLAKGLFLSAAAAADTLYVGNTGNPTIRSFDPATGAAGPAFSTAGRHPIQISIDGDVLYHTTGRGDHYGQIILATGSATESPANSPDGSTNTAGANWGLDHDEAGKVYMSLDRRGDGRGFIRYTGPGDDNTVEACTTPVNQPNSAGTGLGDVQVVADEVYWGDGDKDGGGNGVPFEIYKMTTNFGNVTETTLLDNRHFTENLREFGALAVSGNTMFITAKDENNWKLFIYNLTDATYSVEDPGNGRLWDVDVFNNEVYVGTDDGVRVYSLAGAFLRTIGAGSGAHSLEFVSSGSNPDTDGDGMPNVWEDLYGLNPNHPADAADDPDGDGTTNMHEYGAGTVPTDRMSVFRLEADGLPSGSIRLRFDAVPGRTYTIESSPSLLSGSWNTIRTVASQPVAHTVEVTVPANPPRAFFKASTP